MNFYSDRPSTNKLAFRPRFSFGWTPWFCLLACGSCYWMPVAAGKELPSLSDLRSSFDDVERCLGACYVEYRTHTVAPDVESSDARYIHKRLVMSAPSSLACWTSHGTELFSSQADPLQGWYLHNADRVVTYNPFNETFTQLNDARVASEVPLHIQKELILMALGWWPISAINFPRAGEEGRLLLFHDVVRSDAYVLSDRMESVHDIECAVLRRPGIDTIWIDVAKGWCPIAREMYTPEAGVGQLLDMWGHSERASGIWVPKVIESRTYRGPYGFGAGQVVTLHTITSVDDCRLNSEVDARLVDFHTPPSAVELLGDGAYRQVDCQGFAHAERIGDWVRRLADDTGRGPKLRERLAVALSLASILMGALGFTVVHRRSRRGRM